MSYTIRQNWLPESKYGIKAEYGMTPEYVTIHETGNNASASNEASYMVGNDNVVGFHVVIDNVEAVECIPFSRNAWHCGDGENGTGNRKSIGIEIAYQIGPDDLYVASVNNAIDYVAGVLQQYGWGVDRLRRHLDWNGKDCPRGINHGRYLNWEQFKEAVQAKLNNQDYPPIQPQPSNPEGQDRESGIVSQHIRVVGKLFNHDDRISAWHDAGRTQEVDPNGTQDVDWLNGEYINFTDEEVYVRKPSSNPSENYIMRQSATSGYWFTIGTWMYDDNGNRVVDEYYELYPY